MSVRLKGSKMAKGLQRQGREAKKPKKEKPKTIAANPSTKGTPILGEKKDPKK